MQNALSHRRCLRIWVVGAALLVVEKLALRLSQNEACLRGALSDTRVKECSTMDERRGTARTITITIIIILLIIIIVPDMIDAR